MIINSKLSISVPESFEPLNQEATEKRKVFLWKENPVS